MAKFLGLNYKKFLINKDPSMNQDLGTVYLQRMINRILTARRKTL